MAEETILIRFRSEDDVSKTADDVQSSLGDVGGAAEKTGGKFSAMGNIMAGVLQGVGQKLASFALDLGGKAIGAVGDFITGSIAEAQQWDSVMAQTAAVVTSTGQAAGFTAQQLGDMAGAMSASAGMSLFSDDAILGAENVLATFTNIKGVSFQGATQAVLDISQALGTDLQSASIQVGKALNDPVAGISALSRVGVSFTADQEAMIKSMVKAGDTAGAQKIILDELAKEFGGSASAAVDTYAGQQVVLSEKMKDAQQQLGEALMPALLYFGDFMIGTVIPAISGAVEAFSSWSTSVNAASYIGDFFQGVNDVIAQIPTYVNMASAAFAQFAAFMQPVTDAAVSFGATVGPVMQQVGASITQFMASPEVQAAITALSGALMALATMMRDILAAEITAVGQSIVATWNLFLTAWPYIEPGVTALVNGITGFATLLTGIFTAISQLVKGDFTGAWTTMSGAVQTAVGQLWSFFQGIGTQIAGWLSGIIGQMATVGQNIVQGIANGIVSGAGAIKDAAVNAAKSAYEAAKAFLGIASPSKLMRDEIGKNFSLGFAQGITRNLNAVDYAGKAAAATASTSTINNTYNFSAAYASTQSESSLMADAQALMIQIGASA